MLGRPFILLAGLLAVTPFLQGADTPRFDAGISLYNAGKYDEALREFSASEKEHEQQPGRLFYQGVCLAKQGAWTAAASYLDRYTQSSAADARGWFWLAQSQLYSKQFGESKTAIQRAIELDSKSAGNYRTLGEIELELKNYDAAYRAWVKANQLDPQDARTTYYIGRLFFEADFLNEAAAWFRETLKIAPKHFAAMTYLGMCAERLNMEKTAGELYAAAIHESKNQGKPFSWAFLSYAALLRQRGKEQEAFGILEEAEKICPEAHLLTLLGQMLAAANQPARAETVVRRAIDMDPAISGAHYRLALLLRARGQAAEAHAEMQKFQQAKEAEERNKLKVQAIRKER